MFPPGGAYGYRNGSRPMLYFIRRLEEFRAEIIISFSARWSLSRANSLASNEVEGFVNLQNRLHNKIFRWDLKCATPRQGRVPTFSAGMPSAFQVSHSPELLCFISRGIRRMDVGRIFLKIFQKFLKRIALFWYMKFC